MNPKISDNRKVKSIPQSSEKYYKFKKSGHFLVYKSGQYTEASYSAGSDASDKSCLFIKNVYLLITDTVKDVCVYKISGNKHGDASNATKSIEQSLLDQKIIEPVEIHEIISKNLTRNELVADWDQDVEDKGEIELLTKRITAKDNAISFIQTDIPYVNDKSVEKLGGVYLNRIPEQLMLPDKKNIYKTSEQILAEAFSTNTNNTNDENTDKKFDIFVNALKTLPEVDKNVLIETLKKSSNKTIKDVVDKVIS